MPCLSNTQNLSKRLQPLGKRIIICKTKKKDKIKILFVHIIMTFGHLANLYKFNEIIYFDHTHGMAQGH